MTTRLDRLVLHALDESQPEALQELGRRCITDNPAAEEEALRWAVLVDPMKDDHEKLTPSSKSSNNRQGE